MKKFNQRDYVNIFITIILFLIILFSIVGFNYVNGSTIDWSSQHWIIPEYFRNLFYKTGDIFPSFAFNLGAGQNIYNLSYYGLLSPFILFSYLLRSVPMINYIMVLMIVIIISSIILMYYWLHKRFGTKYAFIGTLLFLLAAPLIYHTHRHIMFISYMPFLLMALIGVDALFEKNKKVLLTISVFLIVMTSYYYSVASILGIILYAVYRYIELDEEKDLKKFIKTGVKVIFPIIVGILMSAVLIVPTFYSLLSGRGDITTVYNIKELLIPTLNFEEIVFGHYTIGVTSILFFAIAYALASHKKQNKFLSIVFILLTVFPVIMYALSGFMYVRGKVLIPLLPIAILLITNILNDLNTKKNTKFLILFIIIFSLQTISYVYTKNYIYLADTLSILIAFFIYKEYSNKNIFIYSILFFALVNCLVHNYSDTLVTKEDVELQFNTYNYEKLSNIIESDENIYRLGNDILDMESINRVEDIDYYLPSIYSSIENQNYSDFVDETIGNEMQYRISSAISSSKNILFNTYMGVKYLLTNTMVPIGYTNIENSNIYVNESVYPIGYSTTSVMSKSEYDTLSYPDSVYAIMSNIIVDKDLESTFKTRIKEETPKYEIEEQTVTIEQQEDNYIISSEEDGILNLKLNKEYTNKILFITFDMGYAETCLIGDTSITINGVKNTLSCKGWIYPNNNKEFTYVISSNEPISELNIVFSEGKYEISNVKIYSLDYQYILDSVGKVDEFQIDKEKTSGDLITGNINVTQNGYFILTVPYDTGFNIYLDGKKIEYEKVSESFLGFEINEGSHTIQVLYIAPYLLEGLVISLGGYMIFLPIIYSDLKKKKNRG